ncbi:MAG: ArgR family transcriptional regulator, partial [Eggerthellaceae bacterium]|nr:ArgR family transcriptional regulator [Eggerthellaceae bacterium]
MGKREERLAAIRHIVRNTKVSTQAELLRLVAEAGFECTQATISRDI